MFSNERLRWENEPSSSARAGLSGKQKLLKSYKVGTRAGTVISAYACIFSPIGNEDPSCIPTMGPKSAKPLTETKTLSLLKMEHSLAHTTGHVLWRF